jgi:hypothetical protein
MIYLGTLHSDKLELRSLVADFNRELNSIIATHRYVVESVERDFKALYDQFLSAHDPEWDSYDGGDAIWDAEQKLGITPWDVEAHQGMSALTRAVALADVVLARTAATLIAEPEPLVFPGGRLWSRRWEQLFYEDCLVEPYNTAANGFSAAPRTARPLRSRVRGPRRGSPPPGTSEVAARAVRHVRAQRR